MKWQIPLNSGDLQPMDFKVTIREGGELLLDTVVKILCHGYPLRALCNDWVV